MKNLKIFQIIFTLITCIVLNNGYASIEDGYRALLSNKVEEARAIFTEESDSFFDKNKAKGYLGLTFVEMWYLNQDKILDLCFKAVELDKSPRILDPCGERFYWAARSVNREYQAKLTKLSRELIQKWPGESFASNLLGELENFYIADGDLKKAQRVVKQLGVIKEWKYVGPFNNSSNSSFYKNLAPENGFDFSETYDGENGIEVKWNDLKGVDYTPWVFMDFHQNIEKSMNYFATSVHSDKDQKVLVSFGVSGSYSLWINTKKVLEKLKFQNTGMDAFQIPVKLLKGQNDILLKLGHSAEKQSNFSLRILDKNKNPLNLKIEPKSQKKASQKAVKITLLENPNMKSLKADSRKGKLGASLILLNELINIEALDEAIALASKLKLKFPQSAWINNRLSEIYFRRGDRTLGQLYIDRSYREEPNNGQAWNFQLSRIMSEDNPQKSLEYILKKPQKMDFNGRLHLKLLQVYSQLQQEREALDLLDSMEIWYPGNIDLMSTVANMRLKMGNPKRYKSVLKGLREHWGFHPNTAGIFFEEYMRDGNMKEASAFYEKVLITRPNAAGYLSKLASLNIELGEFDKALKLADKMLEVNPFLTKALNKKIQIYEKLRQKDLLIENYEKLLSINFNDFKALNRYQELLGEAPWPSAVKEFDFEQLKKSAAKWKDGRNKNSLILLNQSSLLTYPSGAFEIYERMIVEILDQKGVDYWKETDLSYNSNYENIKIQKALVHKIDGQTLAADKNSLSLVFKNLEPGDFIEIKWRRQHFFSGLLARNFENFFYFAHLVPTLKYYTEALTPLGREYKVKSNLLLMKPKEFQVLGLIGKSWERNNVLGYKPEGRAAKEEVVWPWVHISSFPSWTHISNWYKTLTTDKMEITPELKILADSIFVGKKSDEEKVKAVHHFITEKIRYSSVSFRQAGYTPQTAFKSLATRVGDCKDMAVLAKTLLSIAGVKSDLVLVQTRNNGVSEILPSLEFDHCILKTDFSYVDFTAPNHPWNVLPKQDLGARALVVNDDQENKLRWLPFYNDSIEYIHRLSQDTLRVDASFSRSIQTIRSGDAAAGFRGNLKHKNEEELRKNLEEVLKSRFPSVELGRYEWKGLGHNDSLMEYNYDYQAQNAAFKNSKTIALPIPWVDGLDGSVLVREKSRKYAIQDWRVGSLYGKRVQEMKLQLPKGYAVLDAPESIQIKNKFGYYYVTYDIKGLDVVASRHFYLYPKDVQPKDYLAYKAFMEQVVTSDNGIIILTLE